MDREKVINCLTDIEQIMVCRQEICPREELQYWIELQEGVADALALLKEQEDKETISNAVHETAKEFRQTIVRCKDCKHRDPEDKMCESGHGIMWQLPRPDDWFCADGERKDGE